MMKLVRKRLHEKIVLEEVEEELEVRFEMRGNTLTAHFGHTSQDLLKITPEGICLASWVSPTLPLPRQGEDPTGPIKVL